MKYFLLILSFLIVISCSETAKVGCSDDSDCADDRICDVASKSCVTCKATMCNYDNASGVCEASDNGKIHCAMGGCKDGFWDIDNDETTGCEYSCIVTNNGVEICDSKDNNCDGKIDEGLDCSCNENETNNCTVAGTSCDGTQDCVSGSWGECTTNDTTIGVEICDGIDNDCNDGVDEDFKTNGIYTKDDHCGACNQKCEENHGTNSCDNTGKCNPVCESGWADFDGNGLNGCETGCSSYLYENDNIVTADSETEINDVTAFERNGNILVSYIKKNEFAGAVAARIIDKDGNTVKDEVLLASTALGEFSVEPRVFMTDNYNYILYRDDYLNDGSKKIKLLIKDSNLNLGNSFDVAPSSDSAYLSVENNISGKILMTWTQKDLNFGGGTTKNIYFRAYDETSVQLENSYRILNPDRHNLSVPKITTCSSFSLNGQENYVAIAYCEAISHGSVLKVYAAGIDNTNGKAEVVDNFTNDNCNNFGDYGAVTSDGQSFYISYTKDNNLNIKRYGYGDVSLPHEHSDYEIKLTNEYQITGTEDNHIVNSRLTYRDNNIILSYTSYAASQSGNFTLVSYSKSYIRFNNDLILKNSGGFSFIPMYDLNTYRDSIIYSEDNEVIFIYEEGFYDTKEIKISRTSACEN